MIADDLIHVLANPDCYPEPSDSVTLYQTHLSIVGVIGEHAYKLKKPVRLPFVDFSTLEKRRHFCEEELRLNRRLCPDVYLRVVPLFTGGNGEGVSFCEAAGSEIVDYAVLMRRLPADKMMDVLLADDAVSTDSVRQLAETMAAFHQKFALPCASTEAVGTAANLQRFAMDNFSETVPLYETIFDTGLHRLLWNQSKRDFERYLPLLQERARSGKVVDGHGDLHARNICLRDPPAIFDCIEFNRDLRVQDVAAENAFLVMDLRYRGHRELASAYLDRYVATTGDLEQVNLIPMLLRYRAMVRAKVAGITAGEQEVAEADREECVASARRHLNLAAASAIEEMEPALICACGLPATGKSYVFDSIEKISGWPRFSSDVTRKKLAGIAQHSRAPASCYSQEFSRRTYAELMRTASEAIRSGPVLIDANFGSAELRQRAVACARDAGARIKFVWFQAAEQQIEARMRNRANDSAQVSDADMETYRKLRQTFEPPTEILDLTVVDSEQECGREQKAAGILRYLLEGPLQSLAE